MVDWHFPLSFTYTGVPKGKMAKLSALEDVVSPLCLRFKYLSMFELPAKASQFSSTFRESNWCKGAIADISAIVEGWQLHFIEKAKPNLFV